ncbi:hypothetical protein AVEN_92327-1 [Araneus ventricosus]|uniref:Uncharacterized protein n=1 Tax=Araneus ventricosus TaxID=182803 RepID=A0A4Y2AKM1_ARAVE|nr:hypothetical protein AVEN_92327-1 [Araneus ventricosus]
MPTWPCGLRRLPIALAYRIAGSNPRKELEVSSHSTPYKSVGDFNHSWQLFSYCLTIFFTTLLQEDSPSAVSASQWRVDGYSISEVAATC